MRKTVLDKGYIDFLEQFGDELTIVNAARVSFNNWSKEWTDRDAKLLKYLWTHKHMSPFRHVILRVRIHAPEFVMRQLYKHVIGIESTANSSYKCISFLYILFVGITFYSYLFVIIKCFKFNILIVHFVSFFPFCLDSKKFS